MNLKKEKNMSVEPKDLDLNEEDVSDHEERFAIVNGKAVYDNPKSKGEKDKPNHIWARTPQLARIKAIKQGLIKEDASDVDALFSDENLSEDFKTNAKAIFEAAVLAKVDEQKAELQEAFEKQLEEQAEEFAASLVEKVDDYLNYVVSEWMESNEVAISNTLKASIAEDFMVGLKNLFSENYIEISDEQVDIVEQLSTKVDEIQLELDSAISANAELKEELNQHKKNVLIQSVSEGLSEVQSEKLKSLAENIEYVSDEDYKEKLVLTKKKYFSASTQTSDDVKESLDSDASTTLSESVSPMMAHYVESISRTLKK